MKIIHEGFEYILLIVFGFIVLWVNNFFYTWEVNLYTGLGITSIILGLNGIYFLKNKYKEVDEELGNLKKVVDNTLKQLDGKWELIYRDGVLKGYIKEDIDYYVFELEENDNDTKIVIYKDIKNWWIDKDNKRIVVFDLYRDNDYIISNDVEGKRDINTLWLRRYKYKVVINEISRTKEKIEKSEGKKLWEL